MDNEYIVISYENGDSETFPINTAEERRIAKEAMRRNGDERTRVWRGDESDSVATGSFLYA